MNINVIGLGYIGLPTAIMLADAGLKVMGTDLNEQLVKQLNEGRLTFSEPGLDAYFHRALEQGIRFSAEHQTADMYIVAVPTPFESISKKIDPKYVTSAIRSVIQVAPDNAIIVIESTISPGFVDQHIRPLVGDRMIQLAHAPERIIPGNMIKELISNSRTIGADSATTAEKVKSVYQSFAQGEIVLTDIRTAEMSKVVENTFRDVNIAFANELAKLCRRYETDVYEVIRIANKHPRVNILQPGPGVGGHCIPVDPWFFVGDFPEETHLIHQARRTNDSMPEYVISRIEEVLRLEAMNWSDVGIYGLTYKENVDDTRESPTLQLLHHLDKSDIQPKVYDPMIDLAIVPNQMPDFSAFLNSIKLIVVLVSHKHLLEHQDMLNQMVILDTRAVIHDRPTYKL